VFGSSPVTFVTCSWLVEVATGNPEPDFPSDLYTVEECGARVTSLDGKADLEHTECENGHVRHAYGSAEWQADDMADYWAERAEAMADRF
jgi:hypothetical protein